MLTFIVLVMKAFCIIAQTVLFITVAFQQLLVLHVKVRSRILLFYSLIASELSSPKNLSINITKSSLTLYWTFNNSIDEHLNFTVYCSSMTVDAQQQSNVKSELTIQTKDNNAMLVGLSLNTTYTCCVSAVLSYMETESTCINITTGEHLLSYTTVIHILQTLS